MTWEVFYFVCFLVGFLLSLLTFVAGSTHVHLPHGGHLGGHVHGHAGGAVRGHGQGSGIGSWFNFATVTAFLAWFGGTGYLLTRYSNIWALLGLGIAGLAGVGGASLVFLFLVKFLLAHERDLDPADYNMIGVLGRVSSPVRIGGTGEMIFSQDGVRRGVAVRSDENRTIAKDVEVVVLRYEKGIAYVRPWDELSDLPMPEAWSGNTATDSTQTQQVKRGGQASALN